MKKILIFLTITIVLISILYNNKNRIVDKILTILIDIEFENDQKFDNVKLHEKYDFIIIGGGTAGCAIANRLSENPKWTVLLIEAGGNEHFLMDIPAFAAVSQSSKKLNWNYQTEPSDTSCLAMYDKSCKWPRGRVLGGSSVMNYMIYTRGHHQDFNSWANLTGDTGWSYENVEPYFRKFENFQNDDPHNLYGKTGPVTITYLEYKSNISKAFFNANQELGVPIIDYNDPKTNQIGLSHVQTMTKNGYRVSSNRAYLSREIYLQNRPNLHIKKWSHVTKILINSKEKYAEGVEFFNDNKYIKVSVDKEVILSAGAINSPQLLMLSGIGPEKHLREHNIKPIINLPGVGLNLLDHVGTGGLIYHSEKELALRSQIRKYESLQKFIKNGTGPFTTVGACETATFLNTKSLPKHDSNSPDIELLLCTGTLLESDLVRNNINIKQDFANEIHIPLTYRTNFGGSFTIIVILLKPKSHGVLRLKSANPFEAPSIHSNYFDDPEDLEIIAKSIEFIMDLEQTQAFKDIQATFYSYIIPDCKEYLSNNEIIKTKPLSKNLEYWKCFTRHITFTLFHYSGTCKMGSEESDSTAVVNSKLQVIGMKNLRIADASIMPEIISGHPTSSIYMISEKLAHFVKETWQ